jgi:hypothetical protein
MIGGFEFVESICTIDASDSENPLYLTNADIILKHKGMVPITKPSVWTTGA